MQPMELFHGTTETRAAQISAAGFRPMALDEELAAVSRRYLVVSEAILEGHAIERRARIAAGYGP